MQINTNKEILYLFCFITIFRIDAQQQCFIFLCKSLQSTVRIYSNIKQGVNLQGHDVYLFPNTLEKGCE